ncbi:MAG TPA: glycine-rich protein [Xanthobacteraceae bacterium]|jgi:hypothetical protein
MNLPIVLRYAISLVAALTLLAGCGGSQPPIGTQSAPRTGVDSLVNEKIFDYTGGKQTFRVLSDVSSITVVALGAKGADDPSGCPNGGLGSRVSAVIAVKAQERLVIVVGGAGEAQKGGYNGGAPGGIAQGPLGYGGGGASDVRVGGGQFADRVVAAGGGGGAGALNPCATGYGGKGGRRVGERGGDRADLSYNGGGGGGGGTQNVGGAGGSAGYGTYGSGGAGQNGSLGNGGAGGGAYREVFDGGGGGGGGY